MAIGNMGGLLGSVGGALRQEHVNKYRDEEKTYQAECNKAAYGAPYQPAGVRARAEKTLIEAQNTYERAQAAQRTIEILNKHPEFGELLDLIGRF
jgi:hypothetical protein